MSIPDYRLCDVCGGKTNFRTFSFWVDRAMDAAGSMDNVYEDIDLCGDCCATILRQTTSHRRQINGRDISCLVVEVIKSLPKSKKA